MITFKEWFVILILATRVLGQGSEIRSPAADFHFDLTPQQIQPGEHAILTLTTPMDVSEEESSIQVYDEFLLHQPNLSVLEKTVERTKQGLTIRYHLTSYKNASLTVPPVEVRKSGATYSTESRQLDIKSHRAPNDEEIREGYGILKILKSVWKGIKWTLAFFAATIAGLYLYYWISRRQFKKIQLPEFKLPIPPPKIDHEAWLKSRMQELHLRLGEEPENEFLVDEWSKVLREYYFRTTQKPAPAWTTNELKREANSDSPFGKMLPFLEQCDHFKFKNPIGRKNALVQLLTNCIQQTESNLIACGA